MRLKSISLVLFGLALCCFLQGTAAQEDKCLLKFDLIPSISDIWIYKNQEGNFSSPFYPDVTSATTILTSFRIATKNSSYCDYCTMKVFEGNQFNGTSQVVDFRTKVGNNSQLSWGFAARSYTLQCFPPEPEEEEEIWEPEEEEEEVEPEEEEEIREPEEEEEISEPEEQEEIPPEEEEEEEEEIDLSGQYKDAIFQQMNEENGETLPYELVELRHNIVQRAIDRLISKGILPQGQYSTDRVFATEFATNYEDIYRFNVQVRDQSGVEFRIWFVAYSFHEDPEVIQLVDAGYKENRMAEFPHLEFKVLSPVDESQEPYPAEVEDLGKRSVNQAVGRLIAKNILPQGNYSIFVGYYFFTSIEYSSIVNMTEYPDQEDMLYRFYARVEDQSGTIFRVWAVIATNYETPEYYELIDYGYKQTRLSEFTLNEWREMNEGEDMPLPDEIVQMRNRSVAQSIPRLIAEGTLPAGKYAIAKTYATEFTGGFENPDYPYLTSTPDDIMYRFNVQLSNEAGERFRVAVVVVTNYMIRPEYELIDYFYVENTLDEFTNTKFVSLDEGDLMEKSVNEAVGRLVAKDVLPEGQYTITKTYPTQFSSKFENPDYSDDQYILFNFTAQVNNTAGAGFKVYAVAITEYDNLEDYELIDYGKINA